jgi:heme o synthase
MKPRVMALAVFTALVGLLIAPGHIDPLLAIIAVVAIAAGAGAAGVLNMWYDADIDALMTRTAMRPIPRGRISAVEARVFGLSLAVGAVASLGLATNVKAAALLALAIFLYIAVYTVWLKRSTPQNIVIGGRAGALPPVIGWAAATGQFGLEPLVLFLIIFLWTPPHFWALSLNRSNEYAPAVSPCCRSSPEGQQQHDRSSSTACSWFRFRCSRGHSALRVQSMARPPLFAELFSSGWRFS